jgi:hypothetical protein
VPLRSGGIQIEWHERGIDLEIQVRSQMDVRVSFENAHTGDSWERPIGVNYGPLRGPVRQLSGE